jgi:hypothetical protein
MKTAAVVLLAFLGHVALAQAPALGDPDRDGLPTCAELALGTDPTRPDGDGDGITDGTEACCPKGDARDPNVTEAGRGARIVCWREGLDAWIVLLARPENVSGFRFQAYATGLGRVELSGLAQEVARGTDGTTAWAVRFPPDVFPLLGGSLAVIAEGRDGGKRLRAEGSLVARPSGHWAFLELLPDEGGLRTRAIAAEAAATRPFPVPATSILHTRTCAQRYRLVRVIPDDWEYGEFEIVREDCLERGPWCVWDCGEMVGARSIFLRGGRS